MPRSTKDNACLHMRSGITVTVNGEYAQASPAPSANPVLHHSHFSSQKNPILFHDMQL